MTAAIHPLESAGLCDPSPDQTGLEVLLTLNRRFLKKLLEARFPMTSAFCGGWRSRSPLAMDIYLWLTHRLSYLKKPADSMVVSSSSVWGDYKLTRQFKAATGGERFKYILCCEASGDVFMLWPGGPSVPKLVALPG